MKISVSRRQVIAATIVAAISVSVAFILPEILFPRQPRLTQQEYETLFPFESHYVSLDNGTRIHYIDEGKGPILLLLHGNPASAFLYRHLIADLRDDYRVIAVDYPGFGLSLAPSNYGYRAQEQADTVVEFFDSLMIDDVIVMMQDWGGPIGFHLAQNRSDRVRGLIIGNTWAWPLEGEFRYEVFSWIMGGFIGRGITRSRLGVIHIFLQRGLVKPLPDQAYAAYFQTFLDGDSTPITTFPRELIAATPLLESLEANMSRISHLKALIVWGEQDFAFGEENRHRFEDFFPDHRTVLLREAGHFIQEDSPSEIAEAIRSTFGTH